jgi:CheY-like chemotaxis protein
MRNEALDMVVVDDNPVLVSVLSEIFRECGHTVRAAANGFSALAEIKHRVPDLVLSDLNMPSMSGYELLSVIRRRFPSIRVIAMSGAYSDGCVPPGVAADAFYAKGVSSVAQLVDLVSAVWRDGPQVNRPKAPIWVTEFAIDHVDPIVLLVCCPECLRPFSQQTDVLKIVPAEGTCPHCMTLVEVALVCKSMGTDGTPIAAAASERERDHARLKFGRANGAPTERTHQQ